ncbi:MAG TPA: hypothetical protein DEF41_02540 [Desulfovibrio sp.]|uniref:Uncharacterized protein n=1 Tax=Nitratidesulfovibrio vulgaris (strain ATCC 29579 / DSM 644 / CCUG 34227 / NCIMB 8303 / VKM B-1760 / Hildenborough) TaxID=882 RepID=Q725Z6_NITV2|nr:hypothetical protein DVU_3277 [Nitratidesulfovibrio vulgaris str. Hildenborough]HBW15027.1 hypothetical protein [Desulfovibrio sp.]
MARVSGFLRGKLDTLGAESYQQEQVLNVPLTC